jgi:type IV pilus assembly protein PilQ
MRKQLLAMFLTLLLTNQLVVAAPQAGPHDAANAAVHVNLQRVQVTGTAEGLQVELTASEPVVPKVSTLADPPRLVLDLANTSLTTSQRRIVVDRDGVKAVRLGDTARATRVVVDLLETRDYQVSADGNRLLVTFRSKSGDAPVTSAAPVPTISDNSAPVSASPFAAKASPARFSLAHVKTVAAAVKSTPVSSEPAKPAPMQQAAAKPADIAPDTVFMEPVGKTEVSSKAPDATPEAAPVRALDAAAKFAEKPLDGYSTPTNAARKDDDSSASAPKSEAAVNLAAEQKTQRTQQPAPTGAKYTGEPISVNLKDVDLKDFFRLIHEISGLNVVLDPAVKGNLTLVLDDVPWDQALDIVLKNNDLDRKLEGNVLRIATIETLEKEAKSRQAQQEAETLAVEKVTVTRFLSYARSKDVVATAKKLLSVRGDVIADDRTNALIVQDIPAVIPNIDRLLAQLDRKTQEVEIEARVVAATRSFARDIGTQVGFGWGNGPNAVGGASADSTATGSGISAFPGAPLYQTLGSTAGKPGGSIPLFSNLPATSPTSGLSFINVTNNIRIDAVLTMAESRGLLKILSRPRVVTQNNIQALVKQGVRVPIVTLGQLGGPPTVTYVDAFLRLTVTPQITSEGTIFLNVDVENTTPDFGREVQGNPTLITQQATTQVLVTDGGTVVIGGVIQTQNNLNVQQVPLLGNVPYLGNLFKRRSVSTATQELIFFITPHIVQT